MQKLVATGALDKAFAEQLQLSPSTRIDWRSPLAADEYAEYRDESFLRRLGLERLASDLRHFWPSQGPQWDGLAVTSDGKVILVEAKAHVRELRSSCAAGPESSELIYRSLDESKRHYGASLDADWAVGYYQYANRLAHLQFLRSHGVDAYLVFVYFLHDPEMGRTTLAEWADVLDDCYERLGLARGPAIRGVHSLYVDVSESI